MKNIFQHIFSIFLINIALPLITISANNTDIPDSILTKDHIYQYTFSDQDKAQLIIQVMRERNLETTFVLDIAEGDLYFNNGKYNDALVFYTRALNNKSDENTPTEYMEQLHRIISCYDGLHNEAKKAEYIKLLLNKAEQTGNKEMKSIALFNMGKMIYYQEDKQRGYQLIKEAIEVMKQSDYQNKYRNLRYNYNTLLMMQQRDGKYNEALKTLEDLEAVVSEATNNEPQIDGLDEKERKTLYAWRAVILSFLNRTKEADAAYSQWKTTGKDYTKDDYLITSYLIRRKRFDKVIEIYGAREKFLQEQNDTVNYHMRTLKRLLGKAYEGKGDYVTATQYYKELAILTDSLKVREQKSAAIELATVYETHEKEAKLQEQTMHIKIRNILLISAGAAIFFLILLLWRRIKHERIIRYKNKRMTITIEDLLLQKEKLFKIKEELSTIKRIQKKEKKEDISTNECTVPNDIPECNNNIVPEDQTLFETLDNIVVREKLYLNSNLSREDLMKLIQVNKNRFGHILQQYSGTNATTYINNKRLEHAVRLLKIHPDYTIAAIANLCGIPNIPTFNRLFKAKFGMTPTEFRNSL